LCKKVLDSNVISCTINLCNSLQGSESAGARSRCECTSSGGDKSYDTIGERDNKLEQEVISKVASDSSYFISQSLLLTTDEELSINHFDEGNR